MFNHHPLLGKEGRTPRRIGETGWFRRRYMTLVYNKENQTDVRRKLRNEMNKSEAALWKHLQRSQIGFKFRRQYGIGPYVTDFYCPKVKLAVEVDGISHYNLKAIDHDKKRTAYFTSVGVRIKRYSAKQIFLFIDEVVIDIEHTCKSLDSDRPRNHPSPASAGSAPPYQGGDGE